MCLTFFRVFDSPSNYQFVLAFNRDQASLRETIPFDAFKQDLNIYAGRDIISSGTCLGLNIKTGIIVILTNFDTDQPRNRKSRGKLVYKFLSTHNFSQCKNSEQIDTKVDVLLKNIEQTQQQYTPFNIAIFSIRTKKIWYLNNCTQSKIRYLQKGFDYGLCNNEIDVHWQKTAYGLQIFKSITTQVSQKQFSSSEIIISRLEELMKNDKLFNQDPEQEASIFLHPFFSKNLNQERMTKSTTIILVNKQKQIEVKQISYSLSKQGPVNIVSKILTLTEL